MTLHESFDLIACAIHLALGIFVLMRRSDSPLALPLGLVALSLFSWNFADFGYSVSGQLEWHWLDLGLSPFSPALGFQLVVTFVGGLRRHRWLLLAVYLVFAALAASAWLAFVSAGARAWLASTTYSAAFLAGNVVVIGLTLTLLVAHGRRTTDLVERRRTRLMATSVLAALVFATSDFWDDFGVPVPSLTNIGTTVSALLMAMASLRFRFLGRNLSARLAGVAVALAVLGLCSYLAVFHWLRGSHSILMVATATVTLALIAALRQLGQRYLARRDRVEGLTIMGRFSAQMAHDLKNPLAALKGALQFLGEEVSNGRSLVEQGQMLALLLQQVERINRVVDDYQGLGNVQPRVSMVRLNDVVREVLALQSFAASGIRVETALAEELPPCSVDRDLVGRALENLVRNAVEAVPAGGAVTVRTLSVGTRARPGGVLIAVHDTGPGMDARQSERAFDDFFTTKARGSGLGLAFVRRVVRAHGGRVKIDSRIGEGTIVSMTFP